MQRNILSAVAIFLSAALVFSASAPGPAAAQDAFGYYGEGNLYGGYIGTYADDWWFDVYGIDAFDFYNDDRDMDADEELGFFSERTITWGWLDQKLYFSGVYNDGNRDDDWFFDAYVNAGDEAFWQLESDYP